MRPRIPAEVFPPGMFIAEEVEERGWKPEYVSKRLGLSVSEYEQLLTGQIRLDLRLSVLCGALFGVESTFFSNLEMIYRRGVR